MGNRLTYNRLKIRQIMANVAKNARSKAESLYKLLNFRENIPPEPQIFIVDKSLLSIQPMSDMKIEIDRPVQGDTLNYNMSMYYSLGIHQPIDALVVVKNVS